MSVALVILKERTNWAGWLSICLGLTGASRTFLTSGTVVFGLALLPFEPGAYWPSAGDVLQASVILLLLGGFAYVSYLAYQFGMAHLSTHQTVLILSCELVIAAVSRWLLAGEVMSVRAWVGGSLIICAGLISNLFYD